MLDWLGLSTIRRSGGVQTTRLTGSDQGTVQAEGR